MTTDSETKKGGASDGTSGAEPAEAKFEPGNIVITSNARDALPFLDVLKAMARHVCGDWGTVCPEDRRQNEQALRRGQRLLSAYRASNSVKFWIITDGSRSTTTVLLPEDY